MKLYFILSLLLLSLTNSALSMDETEYPITIHHKQTNRTSLTLHLDLASAIQNKRLSTLSIEKQKRLGLYIPGTTNKNIICLTTDQETYMHIQFLSPQQVDCSKATIRHQQGSRFARVIVPYKTQK